VPNRVPLPRSGRIAIVTPQLSNWIGGSAVPAAEAQTEPVTDPASGEVIAHVPVSGAVDVDRAVTAAREAFPVWSRTSPVERAEALFGLADTLERHAEELAMLEAQDAGKPISAAREDDLPGTIDCLRFFAGAARCIDGKAVAEYTPGRTSMLRREAIGVVGQITPWNYPILMAIWKVGPALATGNTVVLKPAETTPLTTLRLAELAAEHLPDGVLNVVAGYGTPAGEALVAHPEVDMVALTGSVETGKRIARAAADTLKRLHLELGGKAPAVVFADADLEAAIDGIAGAAFYNAGQDCTAATRVLAAAEVYDAVCDGLAQQARAQVLGDTLADATTLGPLNSERQRERVAGFLERRPAHAELMAGGGQPEGPGSFLEATVVAGVKQEDELVQREIFGPVATVQPFASEAEAVALANGTPYGLSSSVWTRDGERSLRMAAALRFGTVWLNAHGGGGPEMPHGGMKASGYGSDMSTYALEEYTVAKHVLATLGEADL
jgi:betaine-aldehyde dehydrogenase